MQGTVRAPRSPHTASCLALNALVTTTGEKQHGAFLESRQDAFFEALEKLPDFEGEIYIRAHSWVPMVSKILPSDTIRIWKRGTQLRCDSALKGLDGIKWKHGRMSHILMGRESAQPGHAIVIDHEGKSFYDVTHALIDPSLTNIDLGLHRLLTAPLSSASMDSTQLMFHKLKDVTKIKPKKEHPCPWTGTKYRMENFSIAAQFRPVVDPKRSHREMQSADTIVDNLQQFVNTLSLHSHKKEHKKKAKDKKQSEQDIEASAASDDEFSNGNNSDRKQVLHLTKGKKMEMHLDVVAGDIIKWNFLSRSKEFSFLATYFHEDAQAVVCRTEGVKNIPIIGEFQVEGNGSFVLSWMNTQKGFTLDRKGIKLKYDVSHTRPAATVPFAEPSTQTSSVLIEEKCELSENQRQQNDEEKCRVFHHPEHIPNPLTTTTSFSEYFFGPAIKAAAESAAIEDEKTKEDTKPKLSSLFKRKPGSENSPPASRVAASNAAAAALSNQESIMKQDGYRNTFRSITKLPATRNLSKSFEAKVLMAESFPFSLVDFLPVITFLSITGEHVKNLEEFFHMVRLVFVCFCCCLVADAGSIRRRCLQASLSSSSCP